MINSSIHPSIVDSFIHSSVDSIYSFIHSYVDNIDSSIHSFVASIDSFIHSSYISNIPLFHLYSIDSFIHSSVAIALIHSFNHLCIRRWTLNSIQFYWFIHTIRWSLCDDTFYTRNSCHLTLMNKYMHLFSRRVHLIFNPASVSCFVPLFGWKSILHSIPGTGILLQNPIFAAFNPEICMNGMSLALLISLPEV